MSLCLGRVNGLAVASASSLPFPLPRMTGPGFGGERPPAWPRRSRVSPERCAMSMKLYVGNLTYEVADAALEQMFAAHGNVKSAQVIMDRDTGRSKGFGFVEMTNDN